MSESETTTENDEATARVAISRFVIDRAGRAADDLGFTWLVTTEAPITYPQLRAAFRHSQLSGEPLPVSSAYSAQTVFTTPEANIAFRFWHDTAHCRLGLSFELADEWELALWHLERLEAAGYSSRSEEYRFLRLDLLRQIILLAVAGRFPLNQQDFTLTCSVPRLNVGILTKLRRIS